MELEATIEELAPGLLRYCRGRAGTLGDLAEEAAQEALTALVARWRLHGPPESPRAFAFTVARRRLGRALFARRLTAPLEGLFGHRDPAPGPAERTAARQQLAAVRQGVAGLPPGEREALLLVVAGELSQGEAARLLGISASALKMRLHRGRRKLAERLASGGGEGAERDDGTARAAVAATAPESAEG